ncbi:MAG: WG repeat-containing protein [Cellulophaga sp.]
MKKLILGIIITLLILACSSKDENYLVKFHKGEFNEIGVPSGYLNSKGDTIIPIGKYYYCYTDTIRDFGMVIEKRTGKILGIDQNGAELYEVFKFDNGPDYVESGLFRIIKNGKIGYANPNGEIVIEPSFDCAYPFRGGFAKVSDNCETIKEGEHSNWNSKNWYQITKNGKSAEK